MAGGGRRRHKLPIRRRETEVADEAAPTEPAMQQPAVSGVDDLNNAIDNEDDRRLGCDEEDDCEAECEGVESDLEADHDEDDGLGSDNDEDGLGVEEELVTDLVEYIGYTMNDDLNGNDDDADSGDDMWNDDGIPNPLSSDDDGDDEDVLDKRKLRNPSSDDQVLWLGKTFSAITDFKYVLLTYALKTRYDIKMYRSESSRVGAMCSEKTCPWRVYCSFEKGINKLMIKVFINEHICVRSSYSKVLKISTIAQLFEERLRRNPKLTAMEMVEDIKMKYNMNVSANQCKKAKTKLVAERKASHANQFARIWDYQAEILGSNEGSTMEIQTIPGQKKSLQRFYRVYMCFDSLREAWKKACRPIIGVDGTFLRWDIKGVLLSAVGRDGDNRIFPIAWAVVDVENNDNWEWFIKHLKEDLKLEDGANVTIISDKHQSILHAVDKDIPNAEHRMCARHILQNWKKNNTDMELERMFWKIARSYTTGEFYDNLEEMRKYNQLAYDSLQRTRPMTWSRAFFKIGSCCNDNLNNLSESFNRSIKNARRKPLLDMLEDIRRQTMQRNAKRSKIANRLKTRYTPRAHAEIELTRDKAKDCIRYMTTGELHEIDYHGVAYRVDMGSRTCGCMKWQLNGIPCIHAMCVITALKLKAEDYASEYYTTHKWREAYDYGIKPVQGMILWPRLNRLPVLPPPSRQGNRGRESNHGRRKGHFESTSNKGWITRDGRVLVCSRCKQEGHNKRRCSNPVAVVEKRPRGRPRKYQVAQG